jgi:hypothetical protein
MSVLLLVVFGSACSDSIMGGNVVGKWSQTEQFPGNSLTLNLVQNGSTVSGDGNWCGEALGCGTVTVTGTASGSTVHLDINFDSGSIEHFDGQLRTFRLLEGSISFQSPGGPPPVPFAAKFERS